MPREATVKDVLYALEYTGANLCRWPSYKPGARPAWSLEPGGLKVSGRTADEVRTHPGVTLIPEQKFGESRYAWKKAA